MLSLLLAFLSVLNFPSGNFSVDLYGQLDTRTSTWGYAEATSWPIQFHPPAGYAIRILRLRGDLTAWPKLPNNGKLPVGSHAGVLLGFETTSLMSAICSPCAGNAPLYYQGSLSDETPQVRVPFDNGYGTGFLLQSDNVLVAKVASFLNTMDKPIHTELTWGATVVLDKVGN